MPPTPKAVSVVSGKPLDAKDNTPRRRSGAGKQLELKPRPKKNRYSEQNPGALSTLWHINYWKEQPAVSHQESSSQRKEIPLHNMFQTFLEQ